MTKSERYRFLWELQMSDTQMVKKDVIIDLLKETLDMVAKPDALLEFSKTDGALEWCIKAAELTHDARLKLPGHDDHSHGSFEIGFCNNMVCLAAYRIKRAIKEKP